MSSRVRVAMRTSSPSRCTWMRMPSSFTSTATGRSGEPPALVIAAPTSGALEASIGRTGRPTSRPKAASASSPPVIAATTTWVVEPASIAARRTVGSGTPAATATASWASASSAPWRSAPVTTPRSQACSSAVARPNRSTTAAARAACEPAPPMDAIASKASCTPRTVSDGSSAGAGKSLTLRQPRPVRRWRSAPPR